MQENVFPIFDSFLDRPARERLLGQQARVIWLTGLSGSGKSTIAAGLERRLNHDGLLTMVLDGDNVRAGLNVNLGFSPEDRTENIRRIAEVSKLFLNCGVIVIDCFVSPTKEIRSMARQIIGPDDFVEVFIDCPTEVCEQRDVKGLYEKARNQKLKDFTGVDAPFEAPEHPALVIRSHKETPDASVERLYRLVRPMFIKK